MHRRGTWINSQTTLANPLQVLSEALKGHPQPPAVRLQGNTVRACTCRACASHRPSSANLDPDISASPIDEIELDPVAEDKPFVVRKEKEILTKIKEQNDSRRKANMIELAAQKHRIKEISKEMNDTSCIRAPTRGDIKLEAKQAQLKAKHEAKSNANGALLQPTKQDDTKEATREANTDEPGQSRPSASQPPPRPVGGPSLFGRQTHWGNAPLPT